MKIVSSIALLVIGSIGSLLLTHTAQSLVIPTNPRQQPLRPEISIKPPVTLQVRQNQAKDLTATLLRQQIVNINISNDNNPEFVQSFDELKVEPLTGQDTDELGGYKYAIEIKGRSVVLHTATPQLPKLKAYFGLVHAYTNSGQLKATESILCESKKILRKQQPIKIADITIRKGDLACPTGYKKL
jgi:Type IV pilin-like G and H, putative